jgi:hypothetical protein
LHAIWERSGYLLLVMAIIVVAAGWLMVRRN